VLYLISKHFPDRAKSLPANTVATLLRPIQRGWFNTLSSATTILALEAYGARVGEGKLTIGALLKDGSLKPIVTEGGLLVHGAFDGTASALRITNDADLHAWYSVTTAGFDRNPPTTELKQGLEILREYTDASGKPVSGATLGQELDVHLKIRATEVDSVGNIAIVDLLPGGFEAVIQPPTLPQDSATTADATPDAAPEVPKWQSPVGVAGSTWQPEYADVRDDRVVIYGTATRNVGEFIYRIRATNAGTFIVPPAYGESMYDRTVQARSLGGKMDVTKK
jgi:alpha-2-macroglobulin